MGYTRVDDIRNAFEEMDHRFQAALARVVRVTNPPGGGGVKKSMTGFLKMESGSPFIKNTPLGRKRLFFWMGGMDYHEKWEHLNTGPRHSFGGFMAYLKRVPLPG